MKKPWLIIALVISGCANNSPVIGTCPKMPPVDARLMEPETADYQTLMSNFLFKPDAKGTDSATK